MKSLHDLIAEGTIGDGRKFKDHNWTDPDWFEPKFIGTNHAIAGVNSRGSACLIDNYTAGRDIWSEYHEPKKTKTVKMYKPVFQDGNNYMAYASSNWRSTKAECVAAVGWMEMDAVIEE